MHINDSDKINIAIAGASGRMGQVLVAAVLDNDKLNLSHTTEKSKPIRSEFDVLIDFTTVEATLANLNFCIEHQKKMVIGTTGFSDDQIAMIKTASEKIAIVMSPNMSIGVNLYFDLISRAAKVLESSFGDTLDVAIIEAHHRHKIDAPSGTALKMGDLICGALSKAKPPTFSSIRAGDIVGDHTVVFATQGERLEITHKASSRATFAQGALSAAVWLQGKTPGLYNMQDVLELF